MGRSVEWMPNLVDDDHITIPNGQSLSTHVNTHGQTIVGFIIPDTLSGTKLKILAARSGDKDNYITVCNTLGTDFELTKSTESGTRYYSFSPSDLLPIQRLKVQSDAVQSGGDCTIYVISRAL